MKTIMIIDDSLLVLKVTKTALEHVGYQVRTLLDPGDFQPDATGMPDLLLVDINMPKFYGDDIVSYIKEAWSLTAPIFLFSDVSEQELERAVHAVWRRRLHLEGMGRGGDDRRASRRSSAHDEPERDQHDDALPPRAARAADDP